MARIVLASASPRRIELLRSIVEDFEILPADLDEEAYTAADPIETAVTLARAKAEAVWKLRPDCLIIAADTVVALENLQLAKPSDADDAKRMLSLLSGRTHRVITGVCVFLGSGKTEFYDETEVSFRTISPSEIDDYVATGEPMDKAGAYAIQGGAAKFVEQIEGSLTNVVGLPMEKLKERLAS